MFEPLHPKEGYVQRVNEEEVYKGVYLTVVRRMIFP